MRLTTVMPAAPSFFLFVIAFFPPVIYDRVNTANILQKRE